MSNNLIQHHIKFYSYTEFYDLIKYGDFTKINFKRLGLIFDERLIISSVLFSEYKITHHPYSLHVNPNSFDNNRLSIVTYLLNDFIERIEMGNKPITVYKAIQNHMTLIKWLNSNKLTFPKNKQEAKKTFQEYTFNLKYGLREGLFQQKEAHIRHNASLKMLKAIFNDNESFISSGINIIKNKKNKPTIKPTENNMKHYFTFYYNIFSQLSDFILSNKKYPFLLKLEKEEIWVFPTKFWIKEELRNKYINLYNVDERKIKNIQEIREQYDESSTNPLYQQRYNLFKNIKIHNNNFRSKERINLARIAFNAYFIQFLILTGMNDSTASTLKWSDEYEILKEEYKFRNIKPRANNKPVDFKIQKEFVSEFKQFLKLRKYLLNGNKFDYLFFGGNDDNARVTLQQKKGSFSSFINERMRLIEPSLPRITSKQMRTFKTFQIIKTDGILATVQVAQSLERTINQSYLGESEETRDNELSNYFNKLNELIFNDNSSLNETSIGSCSEPDNPKTDITIEIFTPDCTNYEGCLFCNKYRTSTQDEDIRKLFSLEFLINECKYIAHNKEQFNNIYSPILNRITSIINEMEKRDSNLKNTIKIIKEDVYNNQNLTLYFEKMLEMYVDLGYLK